MAPPSSRRPCFSWRRTERGSPGSALVERTIDQRVGAGLDAVAALVECLAHVGCNRAGGFGDEAGDQLRSLARVPGAGRSCRCMRDAVMDDGSDVVSVIESTGADEAWQKGVDVVVVGLDPAQLGRQGTERVGGDRFLGLLVGESGGS